MTRMIRKQILIQWKSWGLGYLFILGIGMLGVVLVNVMIQIGDESSYVQMGGLLSGIVFLLYFGTMVLTQMSYHFNQAVTMTRTRKSFFISYYLVTLIGMMLGAVLVLAIWKVETLCYPKLYPDCLMDESMNFLNLVLPYSFLLMIVFSSVLVFCGSALLQFGRKAFWVFWCIWMFSFLILPRMLNAADETPASLSGKAGAAIIRLFEQTSLEMWLLAGTLTCVFCLLSSYFIIIRQKVTQ